MGVFPPTFVRGFHDEAKIEKMNYNRLGSTNLMVSRLSLGTGGFSHFYGEYSLEECNLVVQEALKSGINYIDTGPWYGHGTSEKILGECLRNVPREAYYIGSKVGRYEADPQRMFDFSAEKTRQSVLQSLERLGLEYIDVMQVHDCEFAPSINIILNETIPTLQEFVKEGKIGFIGITGYPNSVLKEVIERSTLKINTVLSYTRLTMIGPVDPMIKLSVFGFATLICFASGANILGIWFHAGRSHHILGEMLFKELARKGHNVTMASPFPLREKHPNYTDIHLTGIQEDQNAREAIFLNMHEGGLVAVLRETLPLVRAQTELTLSHPEMKKLVASGIKFDVIIIDWFMNTAILYFGKLFNAPVIPLASHGTTAMANGIVGNPSPPSYLPVAMIDFPIEMSFLQRVANGMVTLLGSAMTENGNNYHQELIKKHYNDTMTSEEMRKTVALVLSNGHYSYEHPRPFVPNMVPIGGFHVAKPKKLPAQFQTFMDQSDNGVIFFSLGTNMKSVLLPDKTKQELLKVFSKIPYRVIWKWEDENLANKPDNVLISKWCPQNDILAHPKLKLFISHGGLLSTIEAIHHGVPVLGIPIFGDQKTNIPNAVRNGFAMQLELKELNEEIFSKALDEMLNNPKYRIMARKRSLLLRDQPIPPMDAAVFWVEHVIRHKGGDHLRNYGVELPWYQYHMIDVALFVISGLVFSSCFIYYVFISFYRLIRRTVFGNCEKTSKLKRS